MIVTPQQWKEFSTFWRRTSGTVQRVPEESEDPGVPEATKARVQAEPPQEADRHKPQLSTRAGAPTCKASRSESGS